MKSSNKLLLTPSEAASLAGIPRSTFYRLIASSTAPTVVVAGKMRLPVKAFAQWSGTPVGIDVEFPTVTIRSAARLLATGQKAIRALLRSGQLRSVTSTQHPRLRYSDLERFVESLPLRARAGSGVQGLTSKVAACSKRLTCLSRVERRSIS